MRSKPRRALWLAAVPAALVAGFLLLRTSPPASLPPTTLTLLGLTNLPPIGIMTAFAVSNGSPYRLLYDPRAVEYSSPTGLVVVPPDSIVGRVGVVGPGQTYTFFVPGTVTNRSLRARVVARSKAEASTLFMKVDEVVARVSGGRGEAWLGKSYRATLEETGR